MELRRENGPGCVNDSLVAGIVEVHKILLPILWESRGIDGIAVVLRRDVAFARRQIERRNVVGTVAVLELEGSRAGSQSNQLVTHADSHDRNLRRLDQLAKVVHRTLAVGWITRPVRDKDAVEMMSDLVDGIVERESRDRGPTVDETAKDVLFDTAVDKCNVQISKGRIDMEWRLGRNASDKVDAFRIDVGLVFVGIILFSDGDASERRTLLA